MDGILRSEGRSWLLIAMTTNQTNKPVAGIDTGHVPDHRNIVCSLGGAGDTLYKTWLIYSTADCSAHRRILCMDLSYRDF